MTMTYACCGVYLLLAIAIPAVILIRKERQRK